MLNVGLFNFCICVYFREFFIFISILNVLNISEISMYERL